MREEGAHMRPAALSARCRIGDVIRKVLKELEGA